MNQYDTDTRNLAHPSYAHPTIRTMAKVSTSEAPPLKHCRYHNSLEMTLLLQSQKPKQIGSVTVCIAVWSVALNLIRDLSTPVIAGSQSCMRLTDSDTDYPESTSLQCFVLQTVEAR